ncbi:phosphatase PAP2 family protein [Schaalia sp. 19OD2882]|uniref:phosphatase PAP2 family protein n=1 Tax=Schaalia sp. 19OD2882 TaxID=2794089 RepID=UPI001C1EABF7|nr:phosphatase PAP2 family protein [Schaalia sp. 19OD2882]QWW19726.1 phosphatase PAP2 family protein [Schaalia sp. 19OD2882]
MAGDDDPTLDLPEGFGVRARESSRAEGSSRRPRSTPSQDEDSGTRVLPEDAPPSSTGRTRGPSRSRGSSTGTPRSGSRTTPPSGATQAPQVPEDYGVRLQRRIGGALVCVVAAAFVSWIAVLTVWGQGADTLVMEAVIESLPAGERFGELMMGLVSPWSLPVIALVVLGIAVARRRATLAGRAIGMVVAANVTTQVLKCLLERPDLGVTTFVSNSLPSGHVTVSASMCLALVVVAPAGMRGVASWFAWIWTTATGVAVMVSAWHRLADVLVAVLVTGAWALALTPLESRTRYAVVMQKVMSMIVFACAGLALVSGAVALFALDPMAVSMPGASGYGFAEFLAQDPVRSHLLAASGVLLVAAVTGIVVASVDRLCRD